MKKAISHFIRRVHEGHLSGNARRNFRVLIFATLKDQFGVQWMINCETK